MEGGISWVNRAGLEGNLAVTVCWPRHWSAALRANSTSRPSPEVPADYARYGKSGLSFFGDSKRPPAREAVFFSTSFGYKTLINNHRWRLGVETGPCLVLWSEPFNFRFDSGFIFPGGYSYDVRKRSAFGWQIRAGTEYLFLHWSGVSVTLISQVSKNIVNMGVEVQIMVGNLR